MAVSQRLKLTKTAVEHPEVKETRYSISDSEIPGYSLVVTPTGKKVFYLRYRVGGGRGGTIRQPKIGDFGVLTAEKARNIALDWLATIRQGGDPGGARLEQRQAPAMKGLFDRYLKEHARIHKKASSIANDEMLILNQLLPQFGSKKIAELTRSDISAFHRRCCITLPVEDSQRESMSLEGRHDEALSRPLPHDELAQRQRRAEEARRCR